MGTWTYIFQGLLVLSLMVLRKRFVPEYLFSFVVGFFFGIMIDFHELWISWLPQTLPLRVLYFCISYLVICFGIALSNRCRMPIIPTDLFPRELAEITGTAYSRIKISFDVICLLTTAVLTFWPGPDHGAGCGHGAGGLHHGQVHRTHRRVDGPQGELCLYPEPPSGGRSRGGLNDEIPHHVFAHSDRRRDGAQPVRGAPHGQELLRPGRVPQPAVPGLLRRPGQGASG